MNISVTASTLSAPAPVLFEELVTAGGSRIGVATLNAEKTLNALSAPMVELLMPQLLAWRDDPAVALVIFQAAGEKAFCAGGDLQDLYREMKAHHASERRDDVLGNHYALDFFEHEYRLDYIIHTFPKPILSWCHGIVMGGGIGLVGGTSHRVVTERSRLAMPEIAIGLFPDVGGSWFLSRAPGKLGTFLALTAASMNAEDACFAGFADYRITHAAKEAVFENLRSHSWAGRDAGELLGRVLLDAQQRSLAETAFAPSQLRLHYDAIDAACSAPTLAEIIANIGALDADPWLQKCAKALAAGAPGSAVLSIELQRRARHMSLAQIFRMELMISLHSAAGHNFAEGIRALLIDKDQKPDWKPARLADVSDAWIAQFFVNPWAATRHPLADLGD